MNTYFALFAFEKAEKGNDDDNDNNEDNETTRRYDKGRIERQRVVAKATRRLKSILMMKQQIFRCLILFVNKL